MLCTATFLTMTMAFSSPVYASGKLSDLNLTAGAASVLEAAASNRASNLRTSELVTINDDIAVALASNMVSSVSVALSETNLWGYTNLGIANVDNNLNIRETASETGKLVGKLPKDAACEVLELEGNWAHIRSGKVEGYVCLDFLFTGADAINRAREVVSLIATVTTDTLKVREEPNTECAVVTLVPKDEELEAVQTLENGWVEILIDDDTCYVSGEYVDVQEKLQTGVTMTELLYGNGVSDVRVSLCQFAKQYVGNPYVWGGTSLTKGADCSGFVLSVFKNYGYTLPHHAASQANLGTKISASQIQPGDLVFYAKNGSINHVAIYIGGGQVVHASSPKTGIKISNMNYRTPAKIVRILPE